VIARIGAALGASIVVSAAGVRAGALSYSGALAAAAVGTSIVTGASWRGAAVLGAFFAPSSALARIARPNHFGAKAGRRDAAQVFANGGVAGMAALLTPLLGRSRATAMATGALAAAAADTWATEIGSRSRATPRLLSSWAPAPRGASGAVTPLGLLASSAGALSVGCAALLVEPRSTRCVGQLARFTAAGVVGALADSTLGATLQERRWCATCDAPTEAARHACGTLTTVVGGVPGVTNDVINLLCTLTGAAAAWSLSTWDDPQTT
jgi:uncharacterized protein (TIGR00297 family)